MLDFISLPIKHLKFILFLRQMAKMEEGALVVEGASIKSISVLPGEKKRLKKDTIYRMINFFIKNDVLYRCGYKTYKFLIDPFEFVKCNNFFNVNNVNTKCYKNDIKKSATISEGDNQNNTDCDNFSSVTIDNTLSYKKYTQKSATISENNTKCDNFSSVNNYKQTICEKDIEKSATISSEQPKCDNFCDNFSSVNNCNETICENDIDKSATKSATIFATNHENDKSATIFSGLNTINNNDLQEFVKNFCDSLYNIINTNTKKVIKIKKSNFKKVILKSEIFKKFLEEAMEPEENYKNRPISHIGAPNSKKDKESVVIKIPEGPKAKILGCDEIRLKHYSEDMHLKIPVPEWKSSHFVSYYKMLYRQYWEKNQHHKIGGVEQWRNEIVSAPKTLNYVSELFDKFYKKGLTGFSNENMAAYIEWYFQNWYYKFVGINKEHLRKSEKLISFSFKSLTLDNPISRYLNDSGYSAIAPQSDSKLTEKQTENFEEQLKKTYGYGLNFSIKSYGIVISAAYMIKHGKILSEIESEIDALIQSLHETDVSIQHKRTHVKDIFLSTIKNGPYWKDAPLSNWKERYKHLLNNEFTDKKETEYKGDFKYDFSFLI